MELHNINKSTIITFDTFLYSPTPFFVHFVKLVITVLLTLLITFRVSNFNHYWFIVCIQFLSQNFPCN